MTRDQKLIPLRQPSPRGVQQGGDLGRPWIGGRRREIGLERVDRLAGAFGPQAEYAWFTCCTQAYDPRNTKVAKAAA